MAAAPHAGHGELGAAAHPARRAAGVDGHRAGGAARPDRPARRRLRPRLRVDGRRRRARRCRTRCPTFPQGRNPVDTYIPVAQITELLENPGGTLDYDGRALRAARHPPRVLGRRQPVPPPPGPQPPAARVRPARHGRRARAVLDGDGPPRRHRAARRPRHARARRHRRRPQRRLRDRHAPRARRRSARRATTTRSSRELAKRLDVWDDFTEGRTAVEWVEHIYDEFRSSGSTPRTSTVPAVRRVLGRRRGAAAGDVRRPHAVRPASAPIPTAASCRRRAAGSSCSPRRSTASATTTARATRSGSSPTSGSAAPGAEQFPLHLIANQPATRLHGQLDGGEHSQASKVAGPRADPHPSRRRRRARHRRRRRRARVQRPRRVPRRRGRHRRRAPAASSTSRPARGSTRSTRPTRRPAVRATATPTCSPPTGTVPPGAGLDRPARARRVERFAGASRRRSCRRTDHPRWRPPAVNAVEGTVAVDRTTRIDRERARRRHLRARARSGSRGARGV